MKRSPKQLLGLAAMLGVSACLSHEEATQRDEELAVSEQPLYAVAGAWANGVIPICFTAGQPVSADTSENRQRIRDHLYTYWSAVADIEFTGGGTCPNPMPPGVAGIAPNAGGLSFTYAPVAGIIPPTDLNTLDTGFVAGAVTAHELGHTLGFDHEMRRADFSDWTFPGVLCGEGDRGGDTLGTPSNDIASIMTYSYCGNPHPGVLSRWDIVGVRKRYGTRNDNVLSVGSTLYARKRTSNNTGFIFRWNGSGWTNVGNAGGQFVLVGSTLYGLTPDSTAVFRYNGSGTSWTQVGNDARRILACDISLCAENDNGDLFRYSGSGTAWTHVGGPALMYASTATTTYRLTRDRQQVQRYAGGTTWTTVGGEAGRIFATTTRLFATTPGGGNLMRYSGSGTNWSLAGGPGREFVAVGSTLYGLTPDRGQVHRYTGSGQAWSLVGGAADWIYGGTTTLYATHPTTKDIFRYNNSPLNWSHVGQP